MFIKYIAYQLFAESIYFARYIILYMCIKLSIIFDILSIRIIFVKSYRYSNVSIHFIIMKKKY